eukprot:m.84431 g.84431  ORF g.84431 m.84431 type:complete len:636 (-) comp14804_c1_seq1:503-2410(-)
MFARTRDPDLVPAVREKGPEKMKWGYLEKPRHHPHRIAAEKAAKVIQKHVRAWLDKRHKSATKIQRKYRQHVKAKKGPPTTLENVPEEDEAGVAQEEPGEPEEPEADPEVGPEHEAKQLRTGGVDVEVKQEEEQQPDPSARPASPPLVDPTPDPTEPPPATVENTATQPRVPSPGAAAVANTTVELPQRTATIEEDEDASFLDKLCEFWKRQGAKSDEGVETLGSDKYYDCGHRRLTYDGFLLPDVCTYLHLFEARQQDSKALRKWKKALRNLVNIPGKACTSAGHSHPMGLAASRRAGFEGQAEHDHHGHHDHHGLQHIRGKARGGKQSSSRGGAAKPHRRKRGSSKSYRMHPAVRPLEAILEEPVDPEDPAYLEKETDRMQKIADAFHTLAAAGYNLVHPAAQGGVSKGDVGLSAGHQPHAGRRFRRSRSDGVLPAGQPRLRKSSSLSPEPFGRQTPGGSGSPGGMRAPRGSGSPGAAPRGAHGGIHLAPLDSSVTCSGDPTDSGDSPSPGRQGYRRRMSSKNRSTPSVLAGSSSPGLSQLQPHQPLPRSRSQSSLAQTSPTRHHRSSGRGAATGGGGSYLDRFLLKKELSTKPVLPGRMGQRTRERSSSLGAGPTRLPPLDTKHHTLESLRK